ncbi:hypothetical protein GF371_00820 [Candidatus Woesearchaeota archaeon]|nr:hypothetical protein [Candidatus Woesearchaeota archaeon]
MILSILKFLFLGFFVNLITGFDDTITHIPILSSITKTRMGKIAFGTGMFGAIILAIIIAIFFSTIIKAIPFYKEIFAGLLFGLAIAIYFDIVVHKPREKAKEKLLRFQKISSERFTQLAVIGFIASLATVVDDIIAYAPLFGHGAFNDVFVAVGIALATIAEILLVIFFSEGLSKFRHKEKIASAGLVVLAVLILIGVI